LEKPFRQLLLLGAAFDSGKAGREHGERLNVRARELAG